LRQYSIEGHAIVSRDGAIADRSGVKPDGLAIDADWAYFQRQLDDSALVVLGRLSHEADPDRGRPRLVVTSAANGLVQAGPRLWKLDPARLAIADALAQVVPHGGRIAVVGGRRVFDLFLSQGYDAFHLSIAQKCVLPGGVPVFTGVGSAAQAADLLGAHGLAVAERRTLDAAAGAVLWRFAKQAGASSIIRPERSEDR
jgi:dihydrofolate reductase